MSFRGRRLVGVASGLGLLLSVPAVAQTARDTTNPVAGVSTIAIGFSPSPALAGGTSGAAETFQLQLPDELRPLVDRMWRTSPTFRRQCARLAAASVRVDVHVDITVRPKANAATTVEVRGGAVRAVHTRLGVVKPEHLAHELEHVLEQLDGIDLRSAVKNRVADVNGPPLGPFETNRAIEIGRLVAQEVGSGK